MRPLRLFMLGAEQPFWVAIFLLAMTLATGWGIQYVRIDAGFEGLIPDTDPSKWVYHRVSQEFGSDHRTLVYVRDAGLWTPERLHALKELHEALLDLPVVERIDDLFTLRGVRGRHGTIESRPLVGTPPEELAGAIALREEALQNRLVVGNLLSADGQATALMLTLKADPEDLDYDRRAHTALEAALAPFQGRFERLFQVGPPRINSEIAASLLTDMQRLAPLSALILVTTVVLLLRSAFGALLPLLTSLLSLVWTFGLMGWAGLPVNILSAMLPSLVLVIGSTEDIHLIAAYLEGIGEPSPHGKGHTRREATRFMFRRLGVPIVLTILTTALGFAGNLFSGIGLIRDFAIAATFAILANGLITVLLLPLMLAHFGPRSARRLRSQGRVHGLPGALVRVFGFTQHRYSTLVLIGTALLCGFFVYQASKLHVTNDPLSYFRPDRPLLQELRQVQQDLAGTKVFFVTLESDADKVFLEPDQLKKIADIQRFMEKQGIFDRSLSVADLLSVINREFHDGNPEYDRLPRTRELTAQYLLFLHRRDLENYLSHDLRRATIVVRHSVTDSRTLNTHIEELRQVVQQIAGVEMRGYVVGENLMINAAAETLMIGQVKSLAVLLAVIFLVMSIMFTSMKGGLIAMVPALIPIILLFGVMGMLRIPLNPGTAMVAVIAIGIAIDGTIHLFARYNELCRRTADYHAAVREAVHDEATPVITTSLALALGFGVLLESSFTLIAQFGAMAAATLLFSIFANLLITPIVMSRIRLVGLYDILAVSVGRELLTHSPLFQGMTPYQIRKAILISEMHDRPAGARVVEQGALERSMYLILSGRAEVVRQAEDGEIHVTALHAGEVFGEIGFIGETRRTADVRALTPLTLLRFDYEKINKDLRYFPHIVARMNFNISCILGRRLADVTGRLAGPATDGPPGQGAGR